MHTFLSTVPVGRRWVTTEQWRIRVEKRATLCWASHRAGSTLNRRTRKPKRMLVWEEGRHVCILPTPIKSFPYPCDVTYAISEPRPSARLSHGGLKVARKFARAEGPGTRLNPL